MAQRLVAPATESEDLTLILSIRVEGGTTDSKRKRCVLLCLPVLFGKFSNSCQYPHKKRLDCSSLSEGACLSAGAWRTD